MLFNFFNKRYFFILVVFGLRGANIRREMRLLKVRFEAIPYSGNKLFPTFEKTRKKN